MDRRRSTQRTAMLLLAPSRGSCLVNGAQCFTRKAVDCPWLSALPLCLAPGSCAADKRIALQTAQRAAHFCV